jgi:hypothetical protein
MYVTGNPKTKKALRQAVEAGTARLQANSQWDVPTKTGKATVEGPHYPAPHTWAAVVECVDGKIVKVVA